MGVEGIGSSVVIALAAVLWLAYLIPTWFRRREYLSTERNAVRLQQTIRILAETSEVPEPVRLESTARDVARQQKLLRQQFERDQAIAAAKEAVMSRAAARTLATLQPAVAARVVTTSPAAVRLRRSRAATSGVLAVALGTVGMSFTPVAAGFGTVVLVTGLTVAALAGLLLSRLAAVARERARVARELRARPAPPRPWAALLDAAPEEHRATPSAWTPVPLPKPLYLSKPPAQPIVSEATVAEELERMLAATERAERAALAAERAEKVTPIRPAASVPQVAGVPSRFARMGIVDDSDRAVTDLDAVLRRRRAV